MRAAALLAMFLLLSAMPALADVHVQVQRDGYLYVRHELDVTGGIPVALGLLGEPEGLIVLEGGKPAYYTLEGRELLVYPTMNTTLSVTYYTSTPTYKAGPVWFLMLNLTEGVTVELPEGAALVGVSDVPERIMSQGDKLVLELGPGEWNITYIVPLRGQGPSFSFPPLLYLVLSSIIAVIGAFLILRRKRRLAVEGVREDDRRILEYIRSKGGRAYASDIQRALGLPKTTAWRAIRRLERAGLVTVEKDEAGRNVVKLKP